MTTKPEDALVERTMSGETFHGITVAAYRETHPEHGDKYGHSYSEHWSTPSYRDPRVKVERLFTEDAITTLLERERRKDAALRFAHETLVKHKIARALREDARMGGAADLVSAVVNKARAALTGMDK